MCTLRDWTALYRWLLTDSHAIVGMRITYLLIDVLQRSIRVLAVADPMTAHACLAGVLLAFNQHVEIELLAQRSPKSGWRRTTVGGSKRAAKEINAPKT